MALTEAERIQAMKRFHLIRPFLEDGVPLTCIMTEHNISERTLRRWVQKYRSQGLAGLVRVSRKDQGQRRSITPQLQQIIEGLALQRPRRTIANIQAETVRISKEHNWISPSYSTVERITKQLDPALMILAHEGSKVYQEKYDLIYRHQAASPNEIWQADHSFLPIFVLTEQGQLAKPWLTIIIDDYSRAIPGYNLGFDSPSVQRTALALHQAIWHKAASRWHVCGIPAHFYTDNGSDFTSQHLEQVAADLKMELVFSWPGQPRGRGKVERFFQTVEQLFLSHLPGFEGPNGKIEGAYFTLTELDTYFQQWLVEKYHERVQTEINSSPRVRWEANGFLPRMPESLEQLDLLLLHVAKKRRVQQDGIHFQGQRYFDINLAAYVGEDVTIRYDPRDLAVIRVFHDEQFICRAICSELAGVQVSLKEVIQARREQRKKVKQGITERLTVVDQLKAAKRPEPPHKKDKDRFQLKRYFNE